jgi:hypothetical protein
VALVSPAAEAVSVCVPVPTALGVYVTEQVAVGPAPLKVQLAGLNVPLPLLVKLTVPVGVIGVPVSLSVTVAVQVVGAPAGTVGGEQSTVVAVERFVTVTMSVPLLLA